MIENKCENKEVKLNISSFFQSFCSPKQSDFQNKKTNYDDVPSVLKVIILWGSVFYSSLYF